MTAALEELRGRLTEHARDACGRSPLYAELCHAVAGDDETLELVLQAPAHHHPSPVTRGSAGLRSSPATRGAGAGAVADHAPRRRSRWRRAFATLPQPRIEHHTRPAAGERS
ncbi:MAG: hypothetical protein QOJ35_3305 [Solirubrobacteraceae bacterium]|nr:hypothetical protein [Solirubrobacteraceae bacterium]